MMIQIVMPDPLTWEAGLEYGLQALAELHYEKQNYLLFLHDNGLFLEATAFGVQQLGLRENVQYVRNPERRMGDCDIVLFPRVKGLGIDIIHKALEHEKHVVTSDPEVKIDHPRLLLFPRRDWKKLAAIIKELWKR
jgi:hypothetical protein